VKSDFAPGCFGHPRLHQLADGVEDDTELLAVFAFHGGELLGEIRVRRPQLPELHEGPHDRDVHLHRARASDGRWQAWPRPAR
jgi:hypothetical protein